MIAPKEYEQTVKAFYLGTKTQLTVPFEKAVNNDFATQAAKEILGR